MRKHLGVLMLGLGIAMPLSPFTFARTTQATPTSEVAKSTKVAPAARHDLTGVWIGNAASTIHGTGAMTPWGQEQFNANKPFAGPADRVVSVGESNDPFVKCDPMGFPRDIFFQTRGIEFDALPNKMLELFQFQKIWREIWTDGRALPKDAGGISPDSPDARWYGYSIGHWDGDYTFVAETTGLDERSWLDGIGDPHSIDLRVEERYRRVDHDHLEIVATIDDDKAYVKPFTTKPQILVWNPEGELDEQMCVPSEAEAYLAIIAAPAGKKVK